MIPCKTAKANLESCTRLFLLMGLVLALIVTDVLIEYKSPPLSQRTLSINNAPVIMDELLIPETKIEPEQIQEQKLLLPPPIIEEIKVVADDTNIEEAVLSSTETGLSDMVEVRKIDYTQVKEAEVEEEIVEDVPFFIIEQVPVFPGCSGNKEELRKCMEQKVQEFVTKNFDVELAQDLGLESGTKRIFVSFVIDKNGKVTDIQSRAPHKSLQTEAERVIHSLPHMKPGEQRGKPVRVKYSLPIVFKVI
jgi:protein TonB